MFNINLKNEISDVVYELLPGKLYKVDADISAPDAVIVRSADLLADELGADLLAIARAGVGYNNVPVERCSQAGVAVFFSPGANANAVKELVVAGMLLSTRDIVGGIQWVAGLAGQGDKIPALVEKGKGQFVGPELSGKTLGVIGLGNIGGPAATLATHLHMDVIGFDPYMTVDAAWSVSRAVHRAPSEAFLVERADFLTLHVPLNDQTRGKINADFIAQMKDGAVVLNFSRGEIVDDDAMLAALDSGKLRAYVTDFPNEKLIGHAKVIAIPHLGASTPESEENCARMAAEQIDAFLRVGSVRNSVNLPDCELTALTAHRLSVVHKNVPAMISRITSAVGEAGLNITDMVNRSRKELAYTVLDSETAFSPEILAQLRGIEGVLRARVIG